LVEGLVGAAALAIAALTLWMLFGLVAHPEPTAKADPLTMWAVLYAVGFLAFVAALFGLRLIVPRWRLAGGRVVGRQGVAAFTLLYGLLFLLSLAHGSPEAERTGVAVLFGLALAAALRSTFGRRKAG
jgi:hypothetical protein